MFVERYITRVADKPPEIVVEAVNPECIERVRERDAESVDVYLGEDWIRVAGTVEQFVKAANYILFEPDDASGSNETPDSDPA